MYIAVKFNRLQPIYKRESESQTYSFRGTYCKGRSWSKGRQAASQRVMVTPLSDKTDIVRSGQSRKELVSYTY